MLKKENNYDFRERLLILHEKNIRNMELTPSKKEFEIKNGAKIVVSNNASEVIITAAKDFADFLFTSMNVSASVISGTEYAREGDIVIQTADEAEVDLGEYAEYKGVIMTVDDRISVIGYDDRGCASGLYFAEDMMTFRKAPFLEKKAFPRKPMYSPTMLHSGFGVDEYPDEHLASIAHEGRDAILVFTKAVDTVPHGYLDFNDLIRRAKKYGIDVYAYSKIYSPLHPNEPGAEELCEATYGELFKRCPELKGVTLVGESVEFPSKDKHITGKTWRDNFVDGIPTGKVSPGWYPCEDYPQWLAMLQKVITKYKPDADIVLWTYNWGYQPEEARVKLINNLPKGITLQATFEMMQPYKLADTTEYCADYTISFCGPGDYFKSEAKAAKENGIKFYSMTNTGGLTWDFGVIPYEPFPYQWIKRYKEMEKAHDETDLCGLMESHHYGFYPSFISKLSKWSFSEPRIEPEEILHTIISSEFGEENTQQVKKALKIWSEGITYYTPTDADQYGPMRVGPSYPITLEQEIKMQSKPYAMFGGSICYTKFVEQMNVGRRSFVSLRIIPETESMKTFYEMMLDGLAILESIKNKNDKLLRLINMGKFMANSLLTDLHTRKMYMLICRAKVERTREGLLKIADEMEELIKAEIKNAEDTIPLVECDSRLGWEPSMEYMTDKEHLLWKIRAEEYVLDFELKNFRHSITM